MPETKQVTTRVLPGFMELLPAGQIAFERMRGTIQASFERFGFVPLVTPIIERSEVLLSKAGGETEKQIYRFTKGENDLSLRFDLTVPLARYVSEHFNQLAFPFRRYAIGTVYRGERPQKGRFREFYQCDIDIIGLGALSLVNDAEILSVIYTTFVNLALPDFTVRINNRKVLNGLFASLGVGPLAVDIMRLVDKREKIGEAAFRGSLADLGLSPEVTARLDEFVQIRGGNAEVLAGLQGMDVQNDLFQAGVRDLAEVARAVEYLGVPLKNFAIDLSIARGLDYYTGTVYETILDDHPEFGSICSGGRYDNLAEQYIDQKLPGVGISIGLTRLFDQLSDAGLVQPAAATITRVLVAPMVPDIKIPLEIASRLREAGVPTEVYLEEARLKKMLNYANKLGIPYAVIVGEDEVKEGLYSLKNMQTGEQEKVSADRLIERVKTG